MTEQLTKKVNRAVRLIKVSVGEETVEVSYSGGKDSDVILELVRMAGVKYRAIYKNTTIDPPFTHQHCRENGVEIHNPTISFLKLIEKKGFPTRRARFCCEKLKEYKIMDMAVQGIRRSESTARAKRYDPNDPIVCRIYGSKKNHVNVILPILEWTDEDVAEFLAERGVKAHPLYYDEQGNFHPERRLGNAHRGRKIPAESVEKMRKALTGRHLSPEHVEKLRIASTGRRQTPEAIEKTRMANLGKKRGPLSEEHKRKLSESLRGTKMGDSNPAKRPEVRAKISEKAKGRKPSEETLRKLSEIRRNMSAETKAKMSASHKGKSMPKYPWRYPDGHIVYMPNNISARFVREGKGIVRVDENEEK